MLSSKQNIICLALLNIGGPKFVNGQENTNMESGFLEITHKLKPVGPGRMRKTHEHKTQEDLLRQQMALEKGNRGEKLNPLGYLKTSEEIDNEEPAGLDSWTQFLLDYVVEEEIEDPPLTQVFQVIHSLLYGSPEVVPEDRATLIHDKFMELNLDSNKRDNFIIKCVDHYFNNIKHTAPNTLVDPISVWSAKRGDNVVIKKCIGDYLKGLQESEIAITESEVDSIKKQLVNHFSAQGNKYFEGTTPDASPQTERQCIKYLKYSPKFSNDNAEIQTVNKCVKLLENRSSSWDLSWLWKDEDFIFRYKKAAELIKVQGDWLSVKDLEKKLNELPHDGWYGLVVKHTWAFIQQRDYETAVKQYEKSVGDLVTLVEERRRQFNNYAASLQTKLLFAKQNLEQAERELAAVNKESLNRHTMTRSDSQKHLRGSFIHKL